MKTFAPVAFSDKSSECYGLEIVLRALQQQGFKVERDIRAKGVTYAVSIFWPTQIYDLIRWRKLNGLNSISAIAGGNTCTTNPAAVMPFVSACFIGDGELWNGELAGEYIAAPGAPKAKRAVCQNIIPNTFEDLQDNRRSFCEISRGCKNKCLFCQYGWIKSYREAATQNILTAISAIRASGGTKSIRVFAADRFQHSGYRVIRETLDRIGSTDTGSDVSLRFCLRHPELLEFTRKCRTGIEGMSYRLRRMIGKPYSDDEITSFLDVLLAHNIKCIDWYMIYGLPTECDEDAAAFIDLLNKLDSVAIKRGVRSTIAIHWNAFTPSALTPMQWCAPAFNYPPARIDRICNHRLQNITLMHKPKMSGDAELTMRVLCIRGSPATAKLIFNVAVRPSYYRANHAEIRRQYRIETGMDLMAEWPIEKPLPWDEFLLYEKDKLKTVWQSALKRGQQK